MFNHWFKNKVEHYHKGMSWFAEIGSIEKYQLGLLVKIKALY